MKLWCYHTQSHVPPCPEGCTGEGIKGCQKHMDVPVYLTEEEKKKK